MFSRPTASFKTAKTSLQTAETTKKYICFLNLLQERWLYTSFINWSKNFSKIVKSSHSQPSFRNLFSQKLTTTKWKEVKKWHLHLNTQEYKFHRNLYQLFARTCVFWQILVLFIKKRSQGSTTKMGKRLGKVVQLASKTKRRNSDKTILYEALFLSR